MYFLLSKIKKISIFVFELWPVQSRVLLSYIVDGSHSAFEGSRLDFVVLTFVKILVKHI